MVRIRSRRHGSALPRRRVPGAGCPAIGSALSGVFVWAEMAAFRLTGRGMAPVLYRRANGWGDKSCLCCDVCRFWLAISLMLSFSLLPLDGELHMLHLVLCGGCRCMRILPCYAAVLIWPVSISSCVVRPLSVVCISPSCCAVVISMLGSHIALCCAADFVCCLCAAAACAFDPRVPVLPVLRFLCHMAAACTAFGVVWGSHSRCLCSAYGCAAVFVCCAAGCLWRRVSCGMVWR